MSEPSTPTTQASLSMLDGYALFDQEERDYVSTEDFGRFLFEIEREAREQATTGLREEVDDAIDQLLGMHYSRALVILQRLRAALAAAAPQAEPRWPSETPVMTVDRALTLIGDHEGNDCCDPKTLEHVAQSFVAALREREGGERP